MRIVYDAAIFGVQRYGGVTRYFTEILPRIAARDDCRVDLFMGFHVSRHGLDRHRKEFERFWGIRRPFIARTHQFWQSLNNRLFRRFSRKLPPFDVYHTTYLFEPQLKTDR